MPTPLLKDPARLEIERIVSNLAAWLRVQFRTKPEKVAS